MLKLPITYTIYDDDETEVTEVFYFNLNKDELAELEFEETGGISAILKRFEDKKDVKDMYDAFSWIIQKSIGERTPDNRGFIKMRPDGSKVWDSFKQSAAFGELITMLTNNPRKAVEFMIGIIPKKLAQEASTKPEFLAKMDELSKLEAELELKNNA